MNKGLIFGLGLAIGGVIGAVGGYFSAIKKAQAEASEQIDGIREYYESRTVKEPMETMENDIRGEEKNERFKDSDSISEGLKTMNVPEKQNYSAYSSPIKEVKPDIVKEPQVISYETFIDGEYDKIVYDYFAGDEIFVNQDNGKICPEGIDQIGKIDIVAEAEVSEEKGTVYIRNDIRGIDLEINVDEGNYSDSYYNAGEDIYE